MENLRRPHDFAKNCNSSVVEDDQEKVKDFVYKHLGEVTDDPLSNAHESSRKDHSSSAKREKPLGLCKVQQRAVFSGKILSFGCSVCKDNLTFSPNDLLKHFRAAHKGTPPTYPCELCDFVTNEFQVLQRHRIEHRNTLVTCELCKDNVQYSLLLLTRHYMMCHSVNGQFKCDWCDFTTVDAGTFVQHIHHHNEVHWKCSKCRHISLSKEDHQSHIKAHSGTFPFTCHICGYGAARSEYLKKHTAVVHKEEAERRNALNPVEDSGLPDSRLYKRSCESQETLRIPKSNCLSESQNGKLMKQELSVEETHHFMDLTVSKKCSKTSHNTELLTPVTLQEGDNSSTDPGSHANGLTVLMVKNKISLPPNCTTKVMGFKMVDGKKHLVLKVIPTAKQDLPSLNHSLVDCADPMVPGPVMNESKVSAENKQSSHSSPHCLAGSPRNGSCTQIDHDDIMAIKVKIEEEETSVFSHDSTPNSSSSCEPTNLSLNSSLTSSATNELCDMEDFLDGAPCTEGSQDNSSVTANCKSNATNHQSEIINSPTVCDENVASLSSPSAVQKIVLSKPVFKESVEYGGIKESLLTGGNDQVSKRNNGSSDLDTMNSDVPSQVTADQNHSVEIQIKKCPNNLNSLDPSYQTCSAVDTGVNTQNTPNQEVFTFHNYSKEMFSSSPSSSQILDNNHTVHEENGCESPQFNLTLAESPEHLSERTCSEVEVDGCVANVDQLLNAENPESVLQDFNIIKIEEDCLPISVKDPETKSNSSAIGNFVEEHANAIITQQLNKDKTGSLGARSDSLKQTKTTLRILQLPDGKQPVLLRATENRFVKAAPSFKLLTSSANPQINVSYMKHGFSKSGQATGLSLTPNTKLTPAAKPQATEKGTTLLSAVKPGVHTTSNHYLINSQGFSGPVILSSAPVDKTAKAQPTCFLVQRSVPLVQAPSTTGFKLASTQVSGSSRPVLAMPVNSVDKSSTPQTGRQAFLLRYISPPKSSMFLNNMEGKTATLNSQANQSSGNKVLFKIVTPAGSLLSSGASTTSSHPLFLTTRPQAQCFLVSSNKTNAAAAASAGAKNFIGLEHSPQNHLKNSDISPSRVNGTFQPCEAERLLAPRPVRPLIQRKRRRKALFDEHPASAHKARRLSSGLPSEKETVVWEPVAKEVERTLRLAPFSSVQQIKCPCIYQPVVVLNHPDADIPEVANIMKVVNRYKGAVSKVSLSENTVQALSGLSALENCSSIISAPSDRGHLRSRPLQSYVRERFLLKMKLRKKSKRKYEVVKELSACQQGSMAFNCWFCGRLFNNQEDWIGHGQRHLMEATRDWNTLL